MIPTSTINHSAGASLFVCQIPPDSNQSEQIPRKKTRNSCKMTYHEAATCDISGLSIGYGYWLVGNGYIGGLANPVIRTKYKKK